MSRRSPTRPQTSPDQLQDEGLWPGAWGSLASGRDGRVTLSLVGFRAPTAAQQGGEGMAWLGLAWQRMPSSPPRQPLGAPHGPETRGPHYLTIFMHQTWGLSSHAHQETSAPWQMRI